MTTIGILGSGNVGSNLAKAAIAHALTITARKWVAGFAALTSPHPPGKIALVNEVPR